MQTAFWDIEARLSTAFWLTGWSVRELALRSETDYSTAHAFFSGKGRGSNVGMATLQKWMRVLGVAVVTLRRGSGKTLLPERGASWPADGELPPRDGACLELTEEVAV